MTMNPEDPPFAPDSQDHESGLHTAVSSPIDVFFQSESPYPRPPSSELDVFDVVGYRLPELEDQPACGQDWTTPGTPGDGFPSFAVFTPPEDMTSPTSAEYAVAYDQYSTSSLPVNGSLSDITLTQDTGLHSPLSYASISPSLTHSTHFDRTSGEVSPSSFYNENSLPGATLSSSSATMDQVTSAPRSPSVTPDLPYAQLIYRALMSVPDHTMSLKQIYEWIQKNTSKSSTPGRGWQNSIRHNLSMNAVSFFCSTIGCQVQSQANNIKRPLRSKSPTANLQQLDPMALVGPQNGLPTGFSSRGPSPMESRVQLATAGSAILGEFTDAAADTNRNPAAATTCSSVRRITMAILTELRPVDEVASPQDNPVLGVRTCTISNNSHNIYMVCRSRCPIPYRTIAAGLPRDPSQPARQI